MSTPPSSLSPGAALQAAAAVSPPAGDTAATAPRSAQPVRWLGLVLPLVILAAWQAASHYAWVPPVFLPSPAATAQSFVNLLTEDLSLIHI